MPLTTPTSAPARAPTCASTMSSAGVPVARTCSAFATALRHCFTAQASSSGVAGRLTSLGKPRGSLVRAMVTIPWCSVMAGSSRKTSLSVAVMFIPCSFIHHCGLGPFLAPPADGLNRAEQGAAFVARDVALVMQPDGVEDRPVTAQGGGWLRAGGAQAIDEVVGHAPVGKAGVQVLLPP